MSATTFIADLVKLGMWKALAEKLVNSAELGSPTLTTPTVANPTINFKTATVAAAGTTAANAGVLVASTFHLVTGADDTKGVVLPAAAAGAWVVIKVADGADLKVWPATGDGINAIAVDSALTVVDDVCFLMWALDGTTWYTMPLLPS